MKRFTAFLLALALVVAGPAHAQLALTHGGKALATSGGGATPGGTITIQSVGAASNTGGANTSLSAPYSAIGTISSGQKLLAVNMLRTSANDTPTDPTDFGANVSTYLAGAEAFATGTGPRRLTVWERTATGSESGDVTVTWTTNSATAALTKLIRLSGANAGWQATTFSNGSDEGGPGISVTGGTSLSLEVNDLVIALFGTSTGDGTALSATISAPGITFGATTVHTMDSGTFGSGGIIGVMTATVTAGSGTAAPTIDVSWSEGVPPASVTFIRVRNAP